MSLAQFINILPLILSATADHLHIMNSLPWTFHTCSHIRGLGDSQETKNTLSPKVLPVAAHSGGLI